MLTLHAFQPLQSIFQFDWVCLEPVMLSFCPGLRSNQYSCKLDISVDIWYVVSHCFPSFCSKSSSKATVSKRYRRLYTLQKPWTVCDLILQEHHKYKTLHTCTQQKSTTSVQFYQDFGLRLATSGSMHWWLMIKTHALRLATRFGALPSCQDVQWGCTGGADGGVNNNCNWILSMDDQQPAASNSGENSGFKISEKKHCQIGNLSQVGLKNKP